MEEDDLTRGGAESWFKPLPRKYTKGEMESPWKMRFVYVQCYFISIAAILGTGILGLPVKIAQAGLKPFLVTFLIGFIMQALLIYLFVELLQRCQAVQMESLKVSGTEKILLQNVDDQDTILHSTEEEEELEDPGQGLLPNQEAQQEKPVPNLHILGVFFLGKYTSYAFNVLLFLQFISIGISYVLAGSEAFAELLHVRHVYIIPFFTWILALGIILAQVVIQPVTSILTLLKGSLLVVTVAVTFVVGSQVHQEIVNDFAYVGTPFLMGTVALGGIVNVMPFLFSEISPNKCQVMWFRRAIVGGLITCTILNIVWCYAVLEIVPQLSVRKVLVEGISNNSEPFANEAAPAYSFIYSNISLEQSEKAGEIATIPLAKILIEQYAEFAWVAWVTEVFIAVSITVSFLVLGSTMKHTIEGWVNSVWSAPDDAMSGHLQRCSTFLSKSCNLKSLAHQLLCLLAFGLIFIVAVCNPKGFVVILDKVASFTLNLEAGLFIFLMLRKSRSEPFKRHILPLPISERLFCLRWALPVYFLFAVGYDVFQSVAYMTNSWSSTPSQLPDNSTEGD
ncbi:uncharacterized protein si:ch211-51h4.2 [Polypterus senegalus]|uniref:uncharacterized protein si:ch211-51h4.2 n=1 Tax=Polypterus senegalus TaxID=55291 RepID=UPI0019668FE4|nr:uncharacterized protein si:ch211-51h4.2 [Polypterus senegalus]